VCTLLAKAIAKNEDRERELEARGKRRGGKHPPMQSNVEKRRAVATRPNGFSSIYSFAFLCVCVCPRGPNSETPTSGGPSHTAVR
jgi:hypothetical protein